MIALGKTYVVEPQRVIYLKQAVTWDHFDPAIPHHEMYGEYNEETLAARAGVSCW